MKPPKNIFDLCETFPASSIFRSSCGCPFKTFPVPISNLIILVERLGKKMDVKLPNFLQEEREKTGFCTSQSDHCLKRTEITAPANKI